MKKKKKVEVVSDFNFYEPLVGIVLLEDDEDEWFEPDDYEDGDIGSATISEMRRQNGDF